MKVLHFIALVIFCNCWTASAANYYWVGGSGNWKDFANHWAIASGGSVFHIRVPNLIDNIYFDANSFTAPGQTVTVDTATAFCRDMDWTGVTNNPTIMAANTSVELKPYGSLTLDTSMNFTFNGNLAFSAISAGEKITTSGRTLPCSIAFNGPGGEWTLMDSLNASGNVTLTYGTLRTNNNNLRCNKFLSDNSNARALDLGTSIVTITQYLTFGGSTSYGWSVSRSLILDADSATIRLADGSWFSSGNGHTYNVIEWLATAPQSGCWNIDNNLGADSLRIKKVITHSFSNCNNPLLGVLLQISTNSSQIDSIISNNGMKIQGHRNNVHYVYSTSSALIYGDTVNTVVVEENAELYGAIVDTVTAAGDITGGGASVGVMSAGGNVEFGGGYDFITTMTVSGNATFTGISQVENCIVYGNLSISTNYQTIDTCQIYGNGTFLSDNNHFGILSIKPGKTFTFGAGKIQTIDSLVVDSDPAAPIFLVSSDVGVPANVAINSSLCTDYLFIQAVHASGNSSLYVGANSVDIANNAGWIFAPCAAQISYSISGAVITETGLPVPGVTVNLSGDNTASAITDSAGLYNFSVEPGGSYTLTPSKNNDVIVNNGSTTADILLMRKHLLGMAPLGSPYKIIASAEANADGDTNVSTLDLLYTRQLILSNSNAFPLSRLWQFVSSDYVFPDASNPFPFDKTRTYTNIATNQTNQNFIGIKLGDVNDSWDANTP